MAEYRETMGEEADAKLALRDGIERAKELVSKAKEVMGLIGPAEPDNSAPGAEA